MLAQPDEGEGGTQSKPLRLLLEQPLEGREAVRAETGRALLKRHPELGVHLLPENIKMGYIGRTGKTAIRLEESKRNKIHKNKQSTVLGRRVWLNIVNRHQAVGDEQTAMNSHGVKTANEQASSGCWNKRL